MSVDKVKKSNILIVDDDEILIKGYASALGNTYDITVAQCGDDVYRLGEFLKKIDLAICEYKLPDFSGVQILKAIKDENPLVASIMVTRYGNEKIAVEAFRSGVSDYIKKPVTYSEIARKVEFYLKHKKSGREAKGNVLYDDCQLSSNLLNSFMGNSDQDKIRKAVAFIDENFATKKISLNSVASTACTSKYHFCRMFKRIMGQTYHAFLTERRVSRAKQMLHRDQNSITEIALAVGYEDASHFNKVFKKITNCTPGNYRDNLKSRRKLGRETDVG